MRIAASASPAASSCFAARPPSTRARHRPRRATWHFPNSSFSRSDRTMAGTNMLAPEQIDVRAVVTDYLRDRFPALAGKPLEDTTPLLTGGVIDSLGILDLTAFLAERLGIQI